MTKIKYISLLLTMITIFLGCASAVQKSLGLEDRKDHEQVAKVKKVAIAAFVLKPAIATGVASQVVGGVSTVQAVNNAKPEANPLAKDLYNKIAAELKSKNNWQILSLNDLNKVQFFAQLAQEKNSGYKGEAQSTHLNKTYIIPTIPNPWNTKYIFTEKERVKLLQELNVDAVLVIGFVGGITKSSGFLSSMNPLASRYLTSSMFFYLFDSSPDPIWQTTSFIFKSEESLGNIHGLEDQQKIDELTVPVSLNALSEFIKKSEEL